MKRILTLLASLTLVASGLHIIPAMAAEDAPEIPEVVQIEDPVNDGNFLNDQGNRGDTGFQGDHATPADGSTVGDLIKVWFTNDAENVSLHFLSQAPGPAATTIVYQAYTNAGEGPKGANKLGCLRWYGLIPGAYSGQSTTYQGPPVIKLVDRCNDGTNVYGNGVEGKYSIAPGPDGTGITTLTFPRSYSPFLTGPSLTAPFASTTIAAGHEAAGNVAPAMIDNTQNGTDYAFTTGAPTKPSKPIKPVKPAKPAKPETPVKAGCDKGKGKKKGCDKTPKPKACAPITPATAGKEAPAITLTDAATADKPVVQTMTMEQKFDEGLLGDAAPTSVNVTVDTASKEIGLYATLEFPARRDYDLWAYFPDSDNQEAASAHGFQPLIDTQGLPDRADQSNTASNHGGESKADSENLVGILTPDCGGYTVTAYTYLGEGGDLDLKLWLGEVKYDPAQTSAEGAAATRAAYEAVLAL